jgi:uncharacterized protein DUF5132
MALLSGRGGLVTGLAIGLGTGLLAAALAPGLGPAIRPKAKAAIKAGLVAAQKGRVALAELGETTEDLFAEARSELLAEQNTGNGADHEARRTPPHAE